MEIIEIIIKTNKLIQKAREDGVGPEYRFKSSAEISADLWTEELKLYGVNYKGPQLYQLPNTDLVYIVKGTKYNTPKDFDWNKAHPSLKNYYCQLFFGLWFTKRKLIQSTQYNQNTTDRSQLYKFGDQLGYIDINQDVILGNSQGIKEIV